MAKEKSERADKKEKKEKRSKSDGVVKKDKKEKKEKREKKDKNREKKSRGSGSEEEAEAEGDEVREEGVAIPSRGKVNGIASVKDEDEMDIDSGKKPAVDPRNLVGALVPFANPLADEKSTKKVLKIVRKSSRTKTIKRGVKECVKAIRKSPSSLPASSDVQDPSAIVILAADISPPDVISHIPVLCEDHNIPYIYIPSRAELGASGNTKRSTSIVMITRDRPPVKQGKKAVEVGKEEDGKEDEEEERKELYSELVGIVTKAGRTVKV